MKTTTATVLLEVICDCPHCHYFQDVSDNYQAIKSLGLNLADFDDTPVIVTCYNCEQNFTVTSIN